MKFLIQTYNGMIKHDFSLALITSIEYNNWLSNNNTFEYILTESDIYPNCIPIGSVEFVCNYLNTYYNLQPKPKNIPIELMDYQWTNRLVINGTEKDIVGQKFIKSNDGIKQLTTIGDSAPIGNYQISDIIDIQSEWRAFVYKGELVGLNNYLGEFDLFPDVNRIKQMIKAYKTQPISYTLDVAISDGKTVIIEVHDFFSCGLYGFSNYKILPYMYTNWFFNYIKNGK